MVYFCAMSKRFNIVILITFLSAGVLTCHAQQQPQTGASKSIYLTPMCVYNGDTIPYVKLPTVYIFKPLKFKNRREMAKYYKFRLSTASTELSTYFQSTVNSAPKAVLCISAWGGVAVMPHR